MKNIPERIYIQLGEDADFVNDYNELRTVSFSTDKINDNDVEYKLLNNNSDAEKLLKFWFWYNVYHNSPEDIYNPMGIKEIIDKYLSLPYSTIKINGSK